MVLGARFDPRFGPLLMFGAGGASVGRLETVSYHLAPITAEEAMQMLPETRYYSLLKSIGNGDEMDFSAIAGALQRISQLATDFPQIRELRIDPYQVASLGTEPMVVDAEITLSTQGIER